MGLNHQLEEKIWQNKLFDPALQLQEFVRERGIKRLNVARSRESKEIGIHGWVMQVLEDAFFWAENHPGMLGGPDEG